MTPEEVRALVGCYLPHQQARDAEALVRLLTVDVGP